jgi:hypothetical protein
MEEECSLLCLRDSIFELYPESISSVYILELLFMIHFNIMLPYRLLKRSLPMMLFNTKFLMYFSFYHSYQMLYRPNIRVQSENKLY